ncbi:histidine phosphatase superfamily [Syncephalis fuscata]|nr:histidine phosphatase superfamily [Syncephalis fuscata]
MSSLLATLKGALLLSVVANSALGQNNSTNYVYNYCQADYPANHTYQPLADARLVHVQMLIRHGDRSPVMTILPNEMADWRCEDVHEVNQIIGTDGNHPTTGAVSQRVVIPAKKPYRNAIWSSGTCIIGQLTSKGVRQHVALGEIINSIYVNRLSYLPRHLDSTTLAQRLYIRSSDVWRTKQSAASLLTGLWPMSHRNKDAKVLPLLTYPEPIETMLGHRTASECPRLMELFEEMYRTPEWQAYLKRYQPLRTHLETVLNTANHSTYDNSFAYYVDPLRARDCNNMPLPCQNNQCITKSHVAELTQSVNEEYTMSLNRLPHSKEVNRLSIGYFLGELRDKLIDAINLIRQGHNPRKFELFSGHDDTVHAIKGMLNAYDMLWPPYASNMLFELWQSTTNNRLGKQFYLRIIYNGRILKTPWCDMNACPIEDYFNYIASYVPNDLSAECHTNRTAQHST